MPSTRTTETIVTSQERRLPSVLGRRARDMISFPPTNLRWGKVATEKRRPDISIVIPLFNERKNLLPLIERITTSLRKINFRYELIFVDDHSEDNTEEYLRSLHGWGPIRIIRNGPVRGKAAALQRGFQEARGSIFIMIDGDLQYPPEAIPAMLLALETYDIVVANRTHRETTWTRSLLSTIYRYIFGRLLLSLRVDVQSGLKVFRAEVLKNIHLHPSPWGFDYEFLFRAKRIGYRIGQVAIIFKERVHGKSKAHPLRTGPELMWGALKLRAKTLPLDIFPFLSYPHISEFHAPGFDNTEDYLFLPEVASIKKHVSLEIVSLTLLCLVALVAGIWLLSALTGFSWILIISASIAVLYLFLIIFKARIVLASQKRKPLSFDKRTIGAIRSADLPLYTILIPLYREAEIIPQVIASLSQIDYPRDKLEIIITLEEYDQETREAIEQAEPPSHVRILTLPNVLPKTKPKALNVAFLQARGEFLVIYDAEVIPEPDQLKKAYLAFRKNPKIACVQTRLDHYNANQNWITKLFNAEFSFHYDLFLPGLQYRGSALPLSGHSTHFRRAALEQIGAWDPYNLTEDCDVGIRLFRKGYKIDMIDSRSNEEATSTLQSWIAQRSRWMQGFIQTSIVHLRHPLRLKDECGGWKNFCVFLVIVPGSVLMNILNLFYWCLLAAWLLTGSPIIQTLFPGPVLYISIFSLTVGNFLFMYLNLIGLYRRGKYSLVKYGLLSFVYWLLLGYAAVRACVNLFFKPHQWEKTEHGKNFLLSRYATLPLNN